MENSRKQFVAPMALHEQIRTRFVGNENRKPVEINNVNKIIGTHPNAP